LDILKRTGIKDDDGMRYLFLRFSAIQLVIPAVLSAASWPDRLTGGNLRFDHGVYCEAAAEYEAALPLADSSGRRAITLYRLALTRQKLAQFALAELHYKEAVNLFRADGNLPNLALSLAGLGEVYRDQYRLDAALEAERRALSLLKRAGLQETRQAEAVLSITASVFHDRHRFKAAQKDLQEASIIIQKSAGSNHPDFAAVLNNLGVVAAELKHSGEAEALLTRALTIRVANFGPQHPLIGLTLLNLSSVYLDQKRYADAGRTCLRSLEMLRLFLPANHPDVIKAQIELALLAHRSGNSAGWKEILEQAVRSADTRDSSISPAYVQLLNLYSEYLREDGEKDESRRFHRRAQQLSERLGWTSPGRSTITVSELESSGLR
jgi:tetratricopeptide (TPR) repeat protein